MHVQAMLESVKRAAADTETALQRAQSDLTAARAEVVQLQDRQAELASAAELGKGLAQAASEADKANLKATAAAAEQERLRARLDELDSELRSAQEERDRKQAEIRSGTKALALATAREEKLLAEIDELKIEVEDLTVRCDEKRTPRHNHTVVTTTHSSQPHSRHNHTVVTFSQVDSWLESSLNV